MGSRLNFHLPSSSDHLSFLVLGWGLTYLGELGCTRIPDWRRDVNGKWSIFQCQFLIYLYSKIMFLWIHIYLATKDRSLACGHICVMGMAHHTFSWWIIDLMTILRKLTLLTWARWQWGHTWILNRPVFWALNQSFPLMFSLQFTFSWTFLNNYSHLLVFS